MALLVSRKIKFNNDMPTSNFDIDGYNLLRADRKTVGKNLGGGCSLYICDNVNFDKKTEIIP